MSRAKFIQSFGFAASGIAQTFREGRNFKVQLAFAVLALALAGVCTALGVSFDQQKFFLQPGEWLAIMVCMGCVLGGECVNTAIEAIVDLASPDYHELAKRAKDCAAGGVLVCAIASLVVACIVFLPRFVLLMGIVFAG